MSKDKHGVEVSIAKRMMGRADHHRETTRLIRELNVVERQCGYIDVQDYSSFSPLLCELDAVFELRDALHGRGPVLCPRCGAEKLEKPKLKRINDRAVTVRCGCGCVYTARVVMRTSLDIREVEDD